MKNVKNRLYYRELQRWVDLDGGQYLELRRERQCMYYKRHQTGECYCSKKELWLCDGACETCKFYCKKELSIENPIQSKKHELDLEDVIADEIDYEEYCLTNICNSAIIEKLRELAPELIIYGKKKLEGKSDRQIAKEMGCARTTIDRKIKQFQVLLETEYEDF